jgi:hypothetical protein
MPRAQDDAGRFAAAHAHVVPIDAQLVWQTVDWRTSVASAVLEADGADNPVLLWTMNGHPLGCT